MVTHDLQSLANACDRIAALAGGRIVAIGSLPVIQASDHPWVKAYFKGRRGVAAAAYADTPAGGG
jgi:phospholipid/cholesterol/gamma-HCH transport system ATP-binding protein